MKGMHDVIQKKIGENHLNIKNNHYLCTAIKKSKSQAIPKPIKERCSSG